MNTEISTSSKPNTLDPTARAVLADLPTLTYDQIREKYGWSRGKTYALATRCNARKTEERIKERAAQRNERQIEALKASLGKTITNDVEDFLDSLPSNSAQLLITSIPYNIGIAYGNSSASDRKAHVYYLGWLLKIISEAARIIRPGGVLFLQVGSTKDDAGNLVPLDTQLHDWICRTGLTFQNRIVWTVPHGLTPKNRLSERYEVALVFSKGPTPTFNPTPARMPQKQPGKRAFKGPNKGELSGSPLGAWPSNVWTDIGNIGHNHPEKTRHPAQFPLSLARRAILLYSLPGDLIIDPFCGSGTSQVAAFETGRAFTGCDLFYADIRAKRLAAAKPDLQTPLPGVTDPSVAVWQAEARRVDLPAPPITMAPNQLDLALSSAKNGS